jgi:Enoyl-CoA hydratase/isomerase
MQSVLSFDELHAVLRYGGESLALQVPPVVMVDLASDPKSWTVSLGEATTTDAGILSVPCVIVGVGSHALLTDVGSVGALIDVVAGDLLEVDEIVGAVTRFPVASVALALLLRGRERRSLDEALVAESATYSMLQAGPEFAAWRSSYSAKALASDVDPPVLLREEEGRLQVVLNRPKRHNAYSAAMRDGLVEALEVAVLDGALQVVLTGIGPSFCSGGELAEFGSFVDPASAHQTRLIRSAARQMIRIADRVTVRAHGFCLGAGIEVAAFASRVVAHPDTVFALPELALGLVPGSGGTASLPPRIGRHRTTFLALTGRRIDASTALAWGLVDEISDASRP